MIGTRNTSDGNRMSMLIHTCLVVAGREQFEAAPNPAPIRDVNQGLADHGHYGFKGKGYDKGSA